MSVLAAPGRVRVLALAALLAVALFAAPTAIGSGDSTADRVETPSGATAVAATEDNTTDRHRNPAAYSEESDREALAIALERQLRQRLSEGTVQLREGEYELAREYVGDSFDERYAAYADIADEIGRGETAGELGAAQEQLVILTEARREYEATYEEYEAARAAGDDERARELARELESLASEINASSTALADHYGAVEENTDADFEESTDALQSVGEEVETTQAEVRAAQFEPTVLSIDADPGTISYTEPLTATGRLATVAGEPIGGERIRLDVGNRSLSVETDADGSFAFTYRPISVPVAAESVSVTYVPENESVYLGSETSVPVSIEQADPTVADPTVSDANGTATGDVDPVAYGDAVNVSTTVTIGGDPVDGIPLALRLGERHLGTVETDADGAVAEPVSIPASVPDGERELSVTIPFDDRAVAGASASTTVTVAETTPALTLETSQVDDEITAEGTLEAAGETVANHSIVIAVGGDPLATATTDAEGRYETAVSLPASATGEVTLTASVTGRGTNLEPTEASATVSAPARGIGNWSVRGVPAWLLGLAATAAASVVGWRLWRRYADEGGTDGRSAGTAGEGAAATDRSRPAAPTLLSRAQAELGADRPNEAVRAAYGAVRRHLGTGEDDARTHWEFYRACEVSAAGVQSLRALTEDYERATFGPERVDDSTADRALSLAHALCDRTDEAIDAPGGPSRADD